MPVTVWPCIILQGNKVEKARVISPTSWDCLTCHLFQNCNCILRSYWEICNSLNLIEQYIYGLKASTGRARKQHIFDFLAPMCFFCSASVILRIPVKVHQISSPYATSWERLGCWVKKNRLWFCICRHMVMKCMQKKPQEFFSFSFMSAVKKYFISLWKKIIICIHILKIPKFKFVLLHKYWYWKKYPAIFYKLLPLSWWCSDHHLLGSLLLHWQVKMDFPFPLPIRSL